MTNNPGFLVAGGSWHVGRLVIKQVLVGPWVLIMLFNFDLPSSLLLSRILPSTSFCMPEIFPATNRWWKDTIQTSDRPSQPVTKR